VTTAPIGDANDASRLGATVTQWSEQWLAGGMAATVEHRDEPDDRGHFHWLIRLRGEEKDVITIWLSLRQRTIHVETEVMPAPEENLETLYRYLLVRNADLRGLHLAIGPEAGIYLVCDVAILEMTIERLDELVGACVTYVDEIFPTAMSMGLSSLYRRRRRG